MLLSIAVLLPVQAAPVQTARPDLVSAPFIVVAGRNMPWNSQATVRARQAEVRDDHIEARVGHCLVCIACTCHRLHLEAKLR